MTGHNDAIDRLLRGALKGGVEAPPGADCLDTETLAAWADQALDADERNAVEAHAAGCARCQSLLAAMVTTTPAAAAASPSRTRALWWLAAMTPVAAALVIWFAVPQRAPVQQSQSAEAAAEQAVTAPAEQTAAAASAPARPAPSADVQAKVKADTPADALARMPDAPPLEKKTMAAPSANAAAESPRAATAQAAPPVATAVPAPAASAAADARTRPEALSAERRVSGFVSAVDSVIVSSNPSTRFRLLPGGGVQRTADAGATWRTEATGAGDTLTAGSSPSPSVCWLVGRAGTVLLSTDGRSWRRLAFPEAVDLRTVAASDNETATVTTADGRAFATTDAGQTWSRLPDF